MYGPLIHETRLTGETHPSEPCGWRHLGHRGQPARERPILFLNLTCFGFVGRTATAGVHTRRRPTLVLMTVNPQLVGESTLEEAIPIFRPLLRLSGEGPNDCSTATHSVA